VRAFALLAVPYLVPMRCHQTNTPYLFALVRWTTEPAGTGRRGQNSPRGFADPRDANQSTLHHKPLLTCRSLSTRRSFTRRLVGEGWSHSATIKPITSAAAQIDLTPSLPRDESAASLPRVCRVCQVCREFAPKTGLPRETFARRL